MKHELKTSASLYCAVRNAAEDGSLEQCIEKAMLKLMNECVFGGILVTYDDLDFPIYYIDDRMLSYLNYPNLADFIMATQGAVINCIKKEDREGLRYEIAHALLAESRYATVCRMLCRDKGYIWVKAAGVPTVLPNGASVLVSLCMDITGQMEAQAELESIVQCPIGGIFRVRMDKEFTLVYANDYYYSLHGFTRENLRQQWHNRTIHLVHPEDVPILRRRMRAVLDRGEQTVSMEYRVIRPDGRIVWLLMNGSLSGCQSDMFLTGMEIDISRQKFIEEHMCISALECGEKKYKNRKSLER